jgi:uncharacterized protein
MLAQTDDEGDSPLPKQHLRFRWLKEKFAICRLSPESPIPEWGLKGCFTSITRTAEELSIVCPVENVPAEFKPELQWTCFHLEGPFSFTETGILASFIGPLSENGVPIFAISTYDTDYVLIREDFAGMALPALQAAGHELIG